MLWNSCVVSTIYFFFFIFLGVISCVSIYIHSVQCLCLESPVRILTVSITMSLLSENFDVEVESAWPSDVLTVKQTDIYTFEQ